MSTVMEQALKQAGVATPSQMERVWRVIKDHPGITSKRIAGLINLNTSMVASYCSVLLARNMISVKYIPTHTKVGRGVGTRNISTFSTNLRSYELLPMPKAKEAVAEQVRPGKGLNSSVTIVHPDREQIIQQLMQPLKKEVAIAQVSEAPEATTAKIDVNKLTVMEARQLYEQLKAIFGN